MMYAQPATTYAQPLPKGVNPQAIPKTTSNLILKKLGPGFNNSGNLKLLADEIKIGINVVGIFERKLVAGVIVSVKFGTSFVVETTKGKVTVPWEYAKNFSLMGV